MGNWPVCHEEAVRAIRAVLIAWGPLCGKEPQLAEALAAAVGVRWEEVAPQRQAVQGAGDKVVPPRPDPIITSMDEK